jgi:hypothetical protein
MQNAQLFVLAGAPAQALNRWRGDKIGAATQHRPHSGAVSDGMYMTQQDGSNAAL